MQKKISFLFQKFGSTTLLLALFLSLVVVAGCGSGGSETAPSSGIFVDSHVSGINYQTEGFTGLTNASGNFNYYSGRTVTFSIGSLTLGSATGADTLTPLSIVAGAANSSDQRVNNILILLQTLDADGDLNNGIQITDGIWSIVSAQAASINFNQTTTAFRTSLAALMTALNAANVFTDTDSRARTVRTDVAAREHFARSTSERIIVNTAYGQLKGYAATATTWQFLGIPYAKPPLGDLRWKPPQAPTAWTGVRDAIGWADQAAQNPLYQSFGEGGMSEDCLYLNVTAPKDAANLPVMVYFHGGGFATLTGNTKAFNNANSLPTKGVILVSVNHRLGPFGYMAHPLLSAESGYSGSGNYGQMDQVQALTWIKNNIANFGGNPGNVTIFGESGGGGKVLYLMTSPKAAGLFHKGICESGMYPPDTRSLATAEAQGTALSAALSATTLAQLRAKSWTEIEAAARTIVTAIPNVDGFHLPDTMRNIYEAGTQNDVPFISGMNKKDMAFGITALIEDMPWFATKRKTNTYVYMFNRVPAGWADKGILAYHGSELLYVFNYPLSAVSHYLLGLVIDPATGVKMVIGDLNGNGVTGSDGDTADIIASEGWSAADTAVADTMMTIWTNFAKTGNPSTTTFTWPAYTAANDTYAELGTTPAAKTGLATAFQ